MPVSKPRAAPETDLQAPKESCFCGFPTRRTFPDRDPDANGQKPLPEVAPVPGTVSLANEDDRSPGCVPRETAKSVAHLSREHRPKPFAKLVNKRRARFLPLPLHPARCCELIQTDPNWWRRTIRLGRPDPR